MNLVFCFLRIRINVVHIRCAERPPWCDVVFGQYKDERPVIFLGVLILQFKPPGVFAVWFVGIFCKWSNGYKIRQRFIPIDGLVVENIWPAEGEVVLFLLGDFNLSVKFAPQLVTLQIINVRVIQLNSIT